MYRRAVTTLWYLAVAALAGCSATVSGLEESDAGAPRKPPYQRLSETGLFVDGQQTARGIEEFAPRYALWTDGAQKQRWISLPAKAQIATGDPAHWELPIGTKLWKEFRHPSGQRLETRMIERIGPGSGDDAYWMGAFIWRPDGSDAALATEGASNILGTNHDVPSQTQCGTCHRGEVGRALGFSALQLSGAGDGLRLADLSDVLDHPVADYTIPGDQPTRDALGTLHANCGHCHNERGAARPDVNMTLQLDLIATTPAETTVWKHTVGVDLTKYQRPGVTKRIVPGTPGASAVILRMASRVRGEQMPPFGTEVVDGTAMSAVANWIDALTVP